MTRPDSAIAGPGHGARTKILCVAGTRPNFVKIAPLMRRLLVDERFDARLVHTGQHYDDGLSRIFFDELAIARPDVNLEVGSGSHAVQTAEIMRRFEPVLQREQPQGVLVVGDVNSTTACALVTAKFRLDRPFDCRLGRRGRPLMIHVEAGLRSFDHEMPEEINRRVTDSISELLFVSDPAGLANLRAEGIDDPARVHFVGNVMIDTLIAARARAMQTDALKQLGLQRGAYALLTLHRPSNVDDPDQLREVLGALDAVAAAEGVPMVFPVHPRTRGRVAAAGVVLDPARWRTCEPIGYLEFLKLMACARLVLSDSGGIQEETTVLGVPCITLRDNTERPVTIEEGTNLLGGTTRGSILAAHARLSASPPAGRVPRLWDGQAAARIVAVLGEVFSGAARRGAAGAGAGGAR